MGKVTSQSIRSAVYGINPLLFQWPECVPSARNLVSESARFARHDAWSRATLTNYVPEHNNPTSTLAISFSIAWRRRDKQRNGTRLYTVALTRDSIGRQERALTSLFSSPLTFSLTSHELRLHVHNVSLRMLVRWYEAHKQYRGRKLKVVTLTRDPISHYRSSFVQRRDLVLPKVYAWQRARLGQDTDESIDLAASVKDFVHELASIIVAAGSTETEACVALANGRWPQHPIVAEEVRHWLQPLTWFDVEVRDIFGLDILATPELRQRGWTIVQNDWVEILALRFEQLNDLVPQIGGFAGVADLALGARNVTQQKTGAAEFLSAMQAAIDLPVGQACVAALHASRYARACGYDQPAQIGPAAAP